jgi:hypothetical protein
MTSVRPFPEIVLRGGPDGVSAVSALDTRTLAKTERIKIPYAGGYEHFERASWPLPADTAPAVFQWVGRTEIAE